MSTTEHTLSESMLAVGTVSFPKCSETISLELLSRTLHTYNIKLRAPPVSLGNLPSFTLEKLEIYLLAF